MQTRTTIQKNHFLHLGLAFSLGLVLAVGITLEKAIIEVKAEPGNHTVMLIGGGTFGTSRETATSHSWNWDTDRYQLAYDSTEEAGDIYMVELYFAEGASFKVVDYDKYVSGNNWFGGISGIDYSPENGYFETNGSNDVIVKVSAIYNVYFHEGYNDMSYSIKPLVSQIYSWFVAGSLANDDYMPSSSYSWVSTNPDANTSLSTADAGVTYTKQISVSAGDEFKIAKNSNSGWNKPLYGYSNVTAVLDSTGAAVGTKSDYLVLSGSDNNIGIIKPGTVLITLTAATGNFVLKWLSEGAPLPNTYGVVGNVIGSFYNNFEGNTVALAETGSGTKIYQGLIAAVSGEVICIRENNSWVHTYRYDALSSTTGLSDASDDDHNIVINAAGFYLISLDMTLSSEQLSITTTTAAEAPFIELMEQIDTCEYYSKGSELATLAGLISGFDSSQTITEKSAAANSVTVAAKIAYMEALIESPLGMGRPSVFTNKSEILLTFSAVILGFVLTSGIFFLSIKRKKPTH
ncbi:MAG: hypothetical protein WC344_02230 [Bacilli bacterium]|jgi:hypothetical protein